MSTEIKKNKRGVAQLAERRSPKPKAGSSSLSTPATPVLEPITEDYIRKKYDLNQYREVKENYEHLSLFDIIHQELRADSITPQDEDDEEDYEDLQKSLEVPLERVIQVLQQYVPKSGSEKLFHKAYLFKYNELWSHRYGPDKRKNIYIPGNQLVLVKTETVAESDESVIKRLMVQEEGQRRFDQAVALANKRKKKTLK